MQKEKNEKEKLERRALALGASLGLVFLGFLTSIGLMDKSNSNDKLVIGGNTPIEAPSPTGYGQVPPGEEFATEAPATFTQRDKEVQPTPSISPAPSEPTN